MLAKQVSPPCGGMIRACRIVASDGSSRNDLSVCHFCEPTLPLGSPSRPRLWTIWTSGWSPTPRLRATCRSKRAELLGEGDLLVLGQVLVAKRQHVMADKGVVNCPPRRLVERLPQIEPDHLGAGDVR